MEENLSIIKEIHQPTGEKGNDIRTYSPLTLAYIGDAAYEIVIRTLIVEKGQQAVHQQSDVLVCKSTGNNGSQRSQHQQQDYPQQHSSGITQVQGDPFMGQRVIQV